MLVAALPNAVPDVSQLDVRLPQGLDSWQSLAREGDTCQSCSEHASQALPFKPGTQTLHPIPSKGQPVQLEQQWNQHRCVAFGWDEWQLLMWPPCMQC